MAKFTSNIRTYQFRFRPKDQASLWEHTDQQFLEISHVSKSFKEALDSLERRFQTGEITLPPVIEPGTYLNPNLEVGADGRITAIVSTPPVEPAITVPDAAGLTPFSTGNGRLVWRAPVVELPQDGQPGQVLTKTGSGVVWADAPRASEATPLVIRSLGDLTVSDGDIIGDGIFEIALSETGVQAGTYTNPILTLDAKGRVLGARSGTASQGETNRDGTYRFWRVLLVSPLSAPAPDLASIAFLDASDAPLTGTQTTAPGIVSVTFAEEVSITGLRIVTKTAAASPQRVIVQGSTDDATFFEVWSISTKDWADNETRIVRRAGSVRLTGDVVGSGEGEIATVLANTPVVPGTYSLASITVDAKGRITAAANGTGGTGGGSFNPDTPIRYLTWIDLITGEEIIETLENGVKVQTPAGMPLENGDTLMLEDGSGGIAPEV